MGQHDPRIDAYIAKSAEFARPILTDLRAVVHAACPRCEEAIFMYRGRILCGMAAFKQHATFWLWHGAMVVAPDCNKLGEAMEQLGR